MSANRLHRRVARGYTIVELVMSLSVLAIGASGVIAMQKVAIASNRHAKDLATASRIAESWADQLALDGSLWTVDTAGASTIANTTWLQLANPSAVIDWFVPNYDLLRGFGPGFGVQGNPVNPAVQPQLIRFCTHLRLAYLHPEGLTSVRGNGLIRAQIRVFWSAEDSSVPLPTSARANLCTVTDAALNNAIGAFHVIYVTTSIAQTPPQ